jgi:hypothetical protein
MKPLTSFQKLVLAGAATCLLLFATTVFAASWALSRYGFVSVRVEDHGSSITLPVPAAFGHWALAAARHCGGMNVYTDDRFVSAAALRAFLSTVGRELEESPDGVYLEVEGRDGWARITKEGSTLRLRVRDDDGASIDVRMPAALARRSVEALRVRG